ncbi:MAG: M3 family metallopeptidase [Acidobacteriota bacterium]|nr:M3 family metallopeptidase [Acidobacteriota bacterium]
MAVGLLASTAYSQETFEPIPRGATSQYRFDLARNFFPSPEAEKAERLKIYAPLEQLESLKGQVASSADNLYRALRLSDQVESELRVHSLYLFLRYATDTKQEANAEEEAHLRAEVRRRRSFLQQEILQIDDQTLTRFFAQNPALGEYRFAIESIRRLRPHTLTVKEEELLNATKPFASDWQGEFYQQAVARINFGTVHTPNGDLDVLRQSDEIENNPDRKVREEGFKKLFAGYASQRDLFAFALMRLIKANNQFAQLRHYKDASDENSFDLYLTTEQVKNLYEQVAQQSEINRRYQRAVANRIRKTAGYEDVNFWDINAPSAGLNPVRFTIGETSHVIQAALQPLGPEYRQDLAALLNPANGRMDIVSGKNRMPGAFASGFPVSNSIFYSSGFEGYYLDLIKLAHESGHAVQSDLMRNNRVPYAYVRGPAYFTESFAIFNELLVADYLYRNETDATRRNYFLEQFLDRALTVFAAATLASLERSIYDGVEQNQVNNANDFDKLTRQTGSRYSIWHEKHRELDARWSLIDEYFAVPLYSVNYVVAQLLALRYYELYARDPQKFIPRYLSLMRNGYNASPENLLRQFLDINLQDPRFASGISQVVESKLATFEAAYGK